MARVWLTVGTGTWLVPPPHFWLKGQNKIEAVGGGGGGAGGVYNAQKRIAGGGGAYAAITNQPLVPLSAIDYTVGAAGIGGSPGVSGTDGGDTWFGAASFGTSLVGAKGAHGGGILVASGDGYGGQKSGCIGAVAHGGGDGSRGGYYGQSPAGGGGSGGPAGAGNNGDSGLHKGGSANAGVDIGAPVPGVDAVPGTEWGFYGCGPGGSEADIDGNTADGGDGATAGGGGGQGGYNLSTGYTGYGGNGGDGLIVITFCPAPVAILAGF